MLDQVELGPADHVQLNGRGYTVDDTLGLEPTGQLQWRDCSAYETVQYRLAV